MAENETNDVEQQAEDGGHGARTAVKAAAAAAATGAAAVAVKKALSSDSNGKSKAGGDGGEEGGRGGKGGSTQLLASVASGGWEAAREHLLPLAEDAAGAAGSYLARNGPDVVREKIVPRFISGFQKARGDG
jgi:hypothetical protein